MQTAKRREHAEGWLVPNYLSASLFKETAYPKSINAWSHINLVRLIQTERMIWI